jgi:uncharacterized protein YgiM (DUF1202 family)
MEMKNLAFVIGLCLLFIACESESSSDSEQTTAADDNQCFLLKMPAYDEIVVDGETIELADMIQLSVTITDKEAVGTYDYVPAEKDAMIGKFKGTIDENGVITAIYTYVQEGMENTQELSIELKDETAIVEGETLPKTACDDLELEWSMQEEEEEFIEEETLRMIGDKVNLRSEPSTKSEIIEQLRINETFDIKEKTAELETLQSQTDYWYKIEKNGNIGWVFGALTTKTLNEKENVEDEFSTLTIWGSKVNVRTKPSIKGDIIMQVNDGQIVDFKKQSEEYETIGYETDYWYHIEVEGKRGWVFGTFTSRRLVIEGCSG